MNQDIDFNAYNFKKQAGILTKKKYTRKGYKEIKGKAKRTRGKEITKIMGLKFNSPLEFR